MTKIWKPWKPTKITKRQALLFSSFHQALVALGGHIKEQYLIEQTFKSVFLEMYPKMNDDDWKFLVAETAPR